MNITQPIRRVELLNAEISELTVVHPHNPTLTRRVANVYQLEDGGLGGDGSSPPTFL